MDNSYYNQGYSQEYCKEYYGMQDEQMAIDQQAKAEAEAQAQIQQQLKILDDSLKYTNYIIIAILLQQKTIRMQRCQLECQAAGIELQPINVCPYRLSSNIIVVWALSYFLNLSNSVVSNETEDTSCKQSCSNQANNIASRLVYFASLIRFSDIICGGSSRN